MAANAGLQVLLDTLERPASSIVLGAGVSYPFAPLVSDLRNLVADRVLSVGIFPAEHISRDEVSDRILGERQHVSPFDDGLMRETLIEGYLSASAVRATLIGLLRPVPPRLAPIQYTVFALATFPLTLINFNNDGLADLYCRRHTRLNMHGTSLSASMREQIDWEARIDALQMYPAIAPPIVRGLLLPGPEPQDSMVTPLFLAASAHLATAQRIALVGYSFGGGDDVAAYTMITSAIRHGRYPAVVVSPDARQLSGRIEADCRSTVHYVSARWEPLARAIVSSIRQPRHKSCDHKHLCVRCVSYLYGVLLNEDRRRSTLVTLSVH
jgi:hypothetical protein